MTGRFLLDSHALVWALFDPRPFGKAATTALREADEVAMSLVSMWELAIKHAKGRLPHSPGAIAMGVGGAGFRELDLGHRHLIKLPHVALPHGDPFDALLCGQAVSEGLTLLTADRVLLDSDYDTMDARA